MHSRSSQHLPPSNKVNTIYFFAVSYFPSQLTKTKAGKNSTKFYQLKAIHSKTILPPLTGCFSPNLPAGISSATPTTTFYKNSLFTRNFQYQRTLRGIVP